MMQVPEWANYLRVDEVIECFNVSDETRNALLVAMPDAYGGEAPGEDDFPEPDSSRDAPYKLSKCWDKLEDAVRQDVVRAHQEFYDSVYG